MKTSRSQLDRILDPGNTSVQPDTIMKAARVLGREVRIELVQTDRADLTARPVPGAPVPHL